MCVCVHFFFVVGLLLPPEGFFYESQLSSLAEVALCERSEKGGRFKTDHFEALPQLNRVATVVDFEADVPGGNWVTVGFDSPLVRPVTCIGGTEKRALGATGMEGERKQERSLTWSTSAASALQLLCKL